MRPPGKSRTALYRQKRKEAAELLCNCVYHLAERCCMYHGLQSGCCIYHDEEEDYHSSSLSSRSDANESSDVEAASSIDHSLPTELGQQREDVSQRFCMVDHPQPLASRTTPENEQSAECFVTVSLNELNIGVLSGQDKEPLPSCDTQSNLSGRDFSDQEDASSSQEPFSDDASLCNEDTVAHHLKDENIGVLSVQDKGPLPSFDTQSTLSDSDHSGLEDTSSSQELFSDDDSLCNKDTVAYYLEEDRNAGARQDNLGSPSSSHGNSTDSEDSSIHFNDNRGGPDPSDSDPDSSDDSDDEDDPPNPHHHYQDPDNSDDNPDDPDDPDDPDNPDGDPQEEGDPRNPAFPENDLLDIPNFSLRNPAFNRLLDIVHNRTVRDAIVLYIALAVKHRVPYQMLVGMFRILNLILGENTLPNTKDQLWSALGRSGSGLRKQAYCPQCYNLLGLYDNLQGRVACNRCNSVNQRRKIPYFITLSIEKQVKEMLDLPISWQRLQYRQNRPRRYPASKEDIFDGDAYQGMLRRGMQPHDLTYCINTDGFVTTTTSTTKAVPIFIRINEVAPHLRQQYVFLAGIWVDKKEPNYNLFMQAFVAEANHLSRDGIAWQPHGQLEVISKLEPGPFIADAPARAAVMNHTTHAGYNSCTFCDSPGVYLDGVKFPLPGTELDIVRRRGGQDVVEHVVVPQVQLRTDASLRQAMADAEPGQRVEGVIGPSSLINLRHFDFVKNVTTDDLHPLYLGVVAFHVRLLLRGLTAVQKAVINRRLLAIKTPTHISRKPRPLKNKFSMRGHEWRNFCLYYGVPVMQGIVPQARIRHFGLLSSALHVLNRDAISDADFQRAARYLQQYKITFQATFGPQNMRFNIHMLDHVITACRNWGPLWAHSTANYESWNYKLGSNICSPAAAASQMAHKFLLLSLVNKVPYDPDIPEDVKEEVDFILNGPKNITLRVGECAFYGNALPRAPTNEEQGIFTDEGIGPVPRLLEFVKMKYGNNNIECRSTNYHPGEDIRSDNSLLYTRGNFFCIIKNIVVVGEICVLFVQRLLVGDPLDNVPHIVELLGEDDIMLIRPEEIRNFSIKIRIGDQWYICPMANQVEME